MVPIFCASSFSHDKGSLVSHEQEYTLEIALGELDEYDLDQGYIDAIRMACGKPLHSVADMNHELLDGMFHSFGKIFAVN